MERNEAIEVIKRNYPHVTESGSQFETALRLLIPELKESDDERIRKYLKRIIGEWSYDDLFSKGFRKEDIIAWLEKQGENNMGISETTKKELEDNLNKALEKETPESWNAFLEKQDEEQLIIRWHSINEEPEEMKELFCEWKSDDATWHDVAFYDKESHTFRHAKMPINVTKWVYVDELLKKQGEKPDTDFSDLRTWKYIVDYVVTKWCGIGQYLDNPYLTTIAEELQKKYYLEQKQGEQKLTYKVEPKFKVGDFVKNANHHGEPIYEIVGMDNECYICEYRGNKSMGDKSVTYFTFDNPYLRLVEKKPADKVEPKFKVGQTIKKEGFNLGFSIVKIENGFYYNDMGDYFPFTDQDNWELVEQKAAWSEDEGKQKQDISMQINPSEYINDMGGNGCYLKNTTQASAWSEEDDKNLKGAIQQMDLLEEYINDGSFVTEVAKQFSLEVCRSVKNWLKSLRPQNRWKPSDEQLNALCWVLDKIKNYPIGGYSISVTHDLLKQLKAL